MELAYWADPPLTLELRAAEVDLWLIRQGDPSGDQLATLSEAERKRSARMRPDIAARYLHAQAVLREVLSRYLMVDPEQVTYRTGKYGKPYLEGGELEFNLSHSEDLALLGVTRLREIGVDIECVRPIHHVQTIAKRYLRAEDHEAWLAAPEELRDEVFVQNWTEFEAVGKAHGVGVARHLDRTGLTVQRITINDAYRAAFARFGAVSKVRRFRWNGG
jgi:4'-phosphopantetheinyl transferase